MAQLRFVLFKQHTGHPVWINPERVIAIFTVSHKGCVGVDTGEGDGWTVQGDAAEVIRRLGGVAVSTGLEG